MGKKKRKYDKGASVGFLMALPTVLGLILLNIYPLCRTVYMSFFKSGAFGKWTFVGLDNYVTMFQSAGFWTVTKNTLLFMLLTVPVTVVLGLLIAVLLNQSINGKTAFRAIYFLPMVVAPAAVAMVWKWLFNAEYGIINIVLGALHLPSKIQWISEPKTALLACAILSGAVLDTMQSCFCPVCRVFQNHITKQRELMGQILSNSLRVLRFLWFRQRCFLY